MKQTFFLFCLLGMLFPLACINPPFEKDVRPLDDNTWILVGKFNDEPQKYTANPNEIRVGPGINLENTRELRTNILSQTREKPYPDDHIYFISTGLKDVPQNPQKCLEFVFAAPKKCLYPYKIFRVFLDKKDISNEVYYSYDDLYREDFTIFQARHMNQGYMDMSKPHQYKIRLEAPDRPVFEKTLEMSAASEGSLSCKTIGFDESHKKGDIVSIDDETMIPLGKSIDIYQSVHDYSHPDMTGFGMDSRVYERLTSKFKEIVGDKQFPNNALLFLYAEPDGTTTGNPPEISFSFVVPIAGAEMADIINVILNGKDITKEFTFSLSAQGNQYVDLCNANCWTLELLNPNKDYTCEINLKMYDGVTYRRTIKFKIGDKKLVELQMAGFLMKDSKTLYDQVMIWTHFTDEHSSNLSDFEGKNDPFPFPTPEKTIAKRMKDPSNWKIEFEDGSPAPKVIKVSGSPMGCTLQLDKPFEMVGKTVAISFSPVEGTWTDPVKLFIGDHMQSK
jgi:hypothetical protein